MGGNHFATHPDDETSALNKFQHFLSHMMTGHHPLNANDLDNDYGILNYRLMCTEAIDMHVRALQSSLPDSKSCADWTPPLLNKGLAFRFCNIVQKYNKGIRIPRPIRPHEGYTCTKPWKYSTAFDLSGMEESKICSLLDQMADTVLNKIQCRDLV